ncbi:hypothetical protein IR073_05440 [Gemella sp. 19428wG2_WT2a]|nr:hypothetical protein [Gemella sp. 19428wG2_WT2a]TFU58573.1 hypothetical protein E4T67_05405 [Gemella sp. WT2a]
MKKEIVKNILLTPIECKKGYKSIILENNIIKTSQKYYSTADEDMSDIAIGFYEILYNELLNNAYILAGDRIKDENFAGDTINTFNTIANIILKDKSKEHRSPIEFWPEYLKKYEKNYSCLANFWLIPTKHGRRSPKSNRYDAVEIYLSEVGRRIKLKEDYFNNFTSLEEFLDIHYLSLETIDTELLYEFYRKKDINKGPNVVNEIEKMIELRAEKISQDEIMCNKLYEYFMKINIIK